MWRPLTLTQISEIVEAIQLNEVAFRYKRIDLNRHRLVKPLTGARALGMNFSKKA
jgi:hypothetical protein